MRKPDGKLLLELLAAGALSFLVGFICIEGLALLPCEGERLGCNIDQAIGAYGVAIWAMLGPLIFGVTLFISRSRLALAGAAGVLLAPLVAFLVLTQIEHTRYLGFEPERQLRAFLVSVLPPALTVLMQYLILRRVVPRRSEPPQ